MIRVERSNENPVLVGESGNFWERSAAFNGCPVQRGKWIDLVYRAQSSRVLHEGETYEVSSIGCAMSADGIHFEKHRQFILPEESWERFGCEDPRVTAIDGTYYIFYTALSTYPFSAEGIKVAVALSKDLRRVDEKHLVTPFNAKAMTLFPEKVNGKFAAILTANTDRPPSTIGLALFDSIEDIWSEAYWNAWYSNLSAHEIRLQRGDSDHVEIGASPLLTEDGWLLIYSHIRNYFTERKIFGIEAVLLDRSDPRKILARTDAPLLVPEEEYELYGKVPNIVFPSGAILRRGKLFLYYGAADSTCCVATCDAKKLLRSLSYPNRKLSFERAPKNPVLSPVSEHAWEAKGVFNPGVIRDGGRTHIMYRALSNGDTSVFGYASSRDGLTIDERSSEPAYVPREPFEMRAGGGYSGCEDPRLTRIDDTIFMFYTAVDGANAPRVAITSLGRKEFLAKQWHRWTLPKLISPPGIDDKDACVFPEKIRGKYVVLHRIQPSIDINFFDDLEFSGGSMLSQSPFILPRQGMWDDQKIGLNTVPIRTDRGWLLLYHGVSSEGSVYRLGAALLDIDHPERVLARSDSPLFEPEMEYEKVGIVPNVVFPCGATLHAGKIFIYYGGADRVVGVASMRLSALLKSLTGE
ncbi:MAG: hypothetical protein IPK84_02355 [Candidatus Moraniibacteriota bacterium]|nr:MAG: hypothetical protein IPK84_02355 [Candidatus Moranbacteria bacterium]